MAERERKLVKRKKKADALIESLSLIRDVFLLEISLSISTIKCFNMKITQHLYNCKHPSYTVSLLPVLSSVRRVYVIWVRVDTLKLSKVMGEQRGEDVCYAGRRRTKLIYC